MRPSIARAEELLSKAEAMPPGPAKRNTESALEMLQRLRPSRERDALLAWGHLRMHEFSNGNFEAADKHLRWGYSYAKGSGDPQSRQLAEMLLQKWMDSAHTRPEIKIKTKQNRRGGKRGGSSAQQKKPQQGAAKKSAKPKAVTSPSDGT